MAAPFDSIPITALHTISEATFRSKTPSDKSIRRKLNQAAEAEGIKQLTFMLNQLELDTICNGYLKVPHKEGANTKSKMLLSKRLRESMEEDLEGWFNSCTQKNVLKTICDCLAIEVDEKSSLSEMKKLAVNEIRSVGAHIVLNRVSVSQLKDCCYEMDLEGWDQTTNKNFLMQAILTQKDVQAPASKPRKPVEMTKKAAIGKCTSVIQLCQHYSLKDLQSWCEKHELTTSGTKKTISKRILDSLTGDKENVSANTKKNTKKPAAKQTKSKSKPEPVEDDEEPEDEESEEETPAPKQTAKKPRQAKPPTNKKKVPESEPEEDEPEEDEPEEDEPEDKSEQEPEESEQPEDAPEESEEHLSEMEVTKAEAEPEESYDEEKEQEAIAAERALRTEEKSESELSVDIESEEDDYPKSFDGVKVHFLKVKDQALADALVKAGGEISAKLTKHTDIVYTTPENEKKVITAVSKNSSTAHIKVISDVVYFKHIV